MKTPGIAVLLLTSLTFVPQVMATPERRFDARTNQCRNIADGQLEWDSRPWGVGGKAFTQVCKKCHSRSNEVGAPFFYVESKTSKGWNRVFAQRKVKCAKDGAWDGLTQDQELKLNDYLYRYAAWSQDAYHNY